MKAALQALPPLSSSPSIWVSTAAADRSCHGACRLHLGQRGPHSASVASSLSSEERVWSRRVVIWRRVHGNDAAAPAASFLARSVRAWGGKAAHDDGPRVSLKLALQAQPQQNLQSRWFPRKGCLPAFIRDVRR